MTHTATSHAVEYTGAKAVFADVDDISGNINIETVANVISNRTKGLIPVHMTGSPCDMDQLKNLCDEKNILLIEDSAHSFGSTLNKKFSGTFGNAGVYSYYSTKAIFAGEGGVVVTDDNNIGNLMKDFIAYDRFKKKMNIGCNIRLSELQALMIYSVVKEYAQIIKNKYLFEISLVEVSFLKIHQYVCLIYHHV